MSFVVRAARRSDCDGIWTLVRQLAAYEKMESRVTGSAAQMAEHLFAERAGIGCLVAELGSRLIGYALYFQTYSSFRAQPMMWLEELAPHEPVARWRHNATGEDNGDAHLKRQVMGREVVVAVTDGKLDFGPWEQIFYGEFDGRRRKRVLVKIVGE